MAPWSELWTALIYMNTTIYDPMQNNMLTVLYICENICNKLILGIQHR